MRLLRGHIKPKHWKLKADFFIFSLLLLLKISYLKEVKLSLNSGWVIITIKIIYTTAQSAGAIEYTDDISAEEQQSAPTSVLDMTLNHLIVRLQSWSFGECRVTFHCYYSQVHSNSEW